MAKEGKKGLGGVLPKKLTVDFSGVDIRKGGANPRIDEGDFLFKLTDALVVPTKNDKTRKQVLWTLKIKDAQAGNEKWIGKTFRHRTGLWDEALWSFRSFLADLLGGEDEVPQSKVDVPLASIVKRKPLIGGSVEDDEYDGKETSKISGTFLASDWKSVKAATTVEDDDEDEEEEDEDEEEEEEETEEEDDEEEEDEEEEEEEKPKKKTKKTKKTKEKKSKKSKKPVVDDDEDEDDEDELDVDEL